MTQTPGDASSAGWSLESIAGDATMQWRFRSLGYSDEFSILATWHRMIESDFSGGSLANFDYVTSANVRWGGREY